MDQDLQPRPSPLRSSPSLRVQCSAVESTVTCRGGGEEAEAVEEGRGEGEGVEGEGVSARRRRGRRPRSTSRAAGLGGRQSGERPLALLPPGHGEGEGAEAPQPHWPRPSTSEQQRTASPHQQPRTQQQRTERMHITHQQLPPTCRATMAAAMAPLQRRRPCRSRAATSQRCALRSLAHSRR